MKVKDFNIHDYISVCNKGPVYYESVDTLLYLAMGPPQQVEPSLLLI